MKVKTNIEIGSKFARLTVLQDLGIVDRGYACGKKVRMFYVKCDCGNEFSLLMNDLKKGRTKSCGCYKKEEILNSHVKHGLYKHPLFEVWQSMKKRCLNSKSKPYASYGGRGISICNEWIECFDVFHKWSIGNGWQKGLQLDRINNNGNYEPTNCRYITPKENNRNRRDTIYIEHNGNKKPLIEYSEIYGIKYKTLKARINRGWSVEKSLSI